MTTPSSAGTRRLGWALAGAVALHLLALWLLRDALGPRQTPATGQARPHMVWVEAAPRATIATAPAAPRRAPPMRRAEESTRPSPRRPSPNAPARHTPPGMEAARAETAEPAGTAAAAPPPDAGHGPGSATAQFLDAPHSQRALARAARAATPAAQAMQALPHGGLSTQEKLTHGLQQARHGDCAKGEFKGGNMGLLSLPALAAAVVRGECSR